MFKCFQHKKLGEEHHELIIKFTVKLHCMLKYT